MTTPVPALAVSRREAAAICGVSVSTIDRAVRDGHLTPARIGRRVVFLVADLAEALERAVANGWLREDFSDPDKEPRDDDDEPAAPAPPDREKTLAVMKARIDRKAGAK
jgi:excisionase family DNA binding protein